MDTDELTNLVEDLRVIGTDKQRIEVKRGIGKSLTETLSAFSNSDGGTIIIGLSEEDGFTVCTDEQPSVLQDKFISACAKLTPIVRPFIDLVPFEGSTVLTAQIQPMTSRDKPCYVTERGRYGGSYLRTGDGDVRMQKYEVDRLIEEQTQPKWDESIVSEAAMSDLDDELLQSFVNSQRTQRHRTFAEGESVALERLRVLRETHPTLAGLLALGIYPQEFFPRLTVTFAEFPGSSKGQTADNLRLVDRATFDGPIPELIEKVVQKVGTTMRIGAQIEGAYRQDLPDYPLVAVREAVTNALMHRDYSPDARGTQVQVNMYVDRLEVVSPGGLYGTVTLRTLGKAGLSSSRNQRLAVLLESVSLPGGGPVAENRGTGIAVMQSELAKSLMPPPEFRDDISSFTVVFRRRQVAPTEAYLTVRERVEMELQRKESVSTSELMRALSASRTSIQKALNMLIEQGLVEATEPPKSPRQRYRAVKKEI